MVRQSIGIVVLIIFHSLLARCIATANLIHHLIEFLLGEMHRYLQTIQEVLPLWLGQRQLILGYNKRNRYGRYQSVLDVAGRSHFGTETGNLAREEPCQKLMETKNNFKIMI